MDFEGIPGSMGRLADGSAFFDRQEIMSRAWDLLRTSNLLLLAPRRVGKSSLLNRMKQDGAARGYNTLYLSVRARKTSWTSSNGWSGGSGMLSGLRAAGSQPLRTDSP